MTDPEKKLQIERMIQKNEEFRRLYEEHRQLSFQVDELSKKPNLKDPEQEELRQLKKKKLATKDTMGRMLFEDEIAQEEK